MEDYIAQARRDREVCQDFLAANPSQHSCTILRRKNMKHLVADTLSPLNGAALIRVAAQRDALLVALKASLATLERENEAHNGPIVDTIWHTGRETLFDFMGAAITQAEGVRK